MDDLKKCSKCSEWKARSEFSKKADHKDGLYCWCKACVHEANRLYYSKNAETERASARARYHANRETRLVQQREWQAANKEHVREYKSRYYQVPEHKEHIREYKRRWNKENRERRRVTNIEWRNANLDYVRAYSREWGKANRHRRSTYSSVRRTRKRELPHTLTPEQWRETLDHFGGCCAACGSRSNLQQDHWIPLISPDCPGTVPSNVVPLCGPCNSSKRDFSAVEWAIRRFGERKGKAIQQRIEAWLTSQKP